MSLISVPGSLRFAGVLKFSVGQNGKNVKPVRRLVRRSFSGGGSHACPP